MKKTMIFLMSSCMHLAIASDYYTNVINNSEYCQIQPSGYFYQFGSKIQYIDSLQKIIMPLYFYISDVARGKAAGYYFDIHCTQQNITTTGTMTIFINRCKLCNEDNIIIDIKGNVGLRINSIMGNKKIEYALSSFEQEQKDIVISDIAV